MARSFWTRYERVHISVAQHSTRAAVVSSLHTSEPISRDNICSPKNCQAKSLSNRICSNWNAEQLIHEGDLALYRAKHLGRNRSVIARPSGLEEVQTVNRVEDQVRAT